MIEHYYLINSVDLKLNRFLSDFNKILPALKMNVAKGGAKETTIVGRSWEVRFVKLCRKITSKKKKPMKVEQEKVGGEGSDENKVATSY